MRRYMARLTEAGVVPGLAMLIGVNPLRSAKSANWMRNNLFGTIIPDAMIERHGKARPIRPPKAGASASNTSRKFPTIPGVAGVHVMAPGNDAAVPEVISRARASG